jgi:hypothetical protein
MIGYSLKFPESFIMVERGPHQLDYELEILLSYALSLEINIFGLKWSTGLELVQRGVPSLN